jgi:hypothetical protein
MRRQLIVNGVIAALALGSLIAVHATRSSPTSSELEARKQKLFATWNRQAVTRVRLRRGGVELELVRDAGSGVEGDFRITKPWQERADIASVSALLGSLELASYLREADGASRKQAGLDQPLIELIVEMAGKSQTLRVGGPAPAPSGSRYLEIGSAGESRLVTISGGVVTELDLPLDKFREPRLLEVGRAEVAKLSISHEQSKVELRQPKPGQFFMARAGSSELAGREGTERMFLALSRLVTQKFADPAWARAEIARDATAIHVTLELSDRAKPAIALSLGAACPDVPGQRVALREERDRAPRAGCVTPDVVEALRVGDAELVLDTPFSARMDEVEQLEISGAALGKEPKPRDPAFLDLVRKGGSFQLRSPAPAEVPLDAGNQRILAIVRARGERPKAARPDDVLGAETGWVRIQLVGSGSPNSETLRLGTPHGDGSLCMKREADAVVLCVDSESAKAFQPDATLLRSLGVLSFAASELKQLTIQTKTLEQRLERAEDGSYALKAPTGFVHDGSLVADVVQNLGALRAERWQATIATAAHGFETPRLRAQIELRSGAKHELVVGAVAKDGYYARLATDPGVFVLSRSTLATLEAPLIDRSLFPRLQAELSRIELSRGARQVTLVRSGDGWSGISSAGRASELVDTLSSLRGDFTVHLGPEQPHEGLARPGLSVTFVAANGKRALLRIGARDTIEGAAIAYARLDSVDATFALAASTLAALQDF